MWCIRRLVSGEEVAKLAYFGLYALQHRGQESAGIAVSDGTRIVVFKDMGLVAQVFDESMLSSLRGHIAVGHCRYSTTGSSVWENAQPTFRSTASGSLALGHNGNLINTLELAAMVEGAADQWRGPVGTSDTDVLTALFADPRGGSVADSALAALPLVRGAFSLVFMDEHTLYAARDPQGFRPLVLGQLERGWVVASETAALDIVGATFVREVEPGELITIDERGVGSARFAPARPRGCLFEYVYLARPDTTIAGRSVQSTRVEVGRGSRPSIRPRPTWSSPYPSRAPRRRSATRRPAASPTARAWSRTPTWAGRSSSPARPSGSGASGSS